MFYRDADQAWRAAPLAGIEWLEHGFGTRHTTWDAAGRLATARQVHSTRCLYVASPGRAGEGDALITDRPGLLLGVRTADCVPVLVADPDHRAVAAIHAGWRGLVAGILSRALEAMSRRFGTESRPLMAAIGPAIGPCCYEVGPEVAVQFSELFPGREDLNRRTRIDLREAARRQLAAAGVPERQIWVAALCTGCRSEDFYSWRREGRHTGRMLSVIGIRT